MSEPSSRIHPVQLRGVGASERSGEERGSVRVRIRTRGTLERSLQIRDAIPLAEAVETLRRDADGLPITLMIACDEFRGRPLDLALELAEFTEPLDALWVAVRKVSPAAETAPISGSVMILNLADGRDRAIASNLVADLLFMSATDDENLAVVKSFSRRTPFVVVPHDAERLDVFGQAAAAASIPVLIWNRSTQQIDAPTADVFWPRILPLRDAESDEEWRTIMSARLAHVATQLTVRDERRITFRKLLAEANVASRPLIQMADEYRWPLWAVETMPSRYVALGEDEKGTVALVWQALLECVATEIEIRDRICGGAFCEIAIRTDGAVLLEELDRAIDERVRSMRFGGDGPFFVEVANAVEQVAEGLSNPSHAARMRNVSKKLSSLR